MIIISNNHLEGYTQDEIIELKNRPSVKLNLSSPVGEEEVPAL